MPQFTLVCSRTKIVGGLVAGLLIVSAAIPWMRNHDYLRDFMDYGLVMAAVGRIEAGESPYVDFVTPIQAGFLHLNHLAEKVGGQTYLGLTYGGLALILLSGFGLTILLGQRWPWPLSAVAGWSITICTAGQHSIIWYNSVGVICLAFATWSAAIAPSVSRKTLVWHAIMAIALWLGGINKINFHLVALAGTTGFALRALWLRRSSGQSTVAMLSLIAISGVILPLLTELALTGASWTQWKYNVLQLAGNSRAEYLQEMANYRFYLRPLHDYYGPLPVPQFGLLMAITIIGVTVWCWRGIHPWDRAMLAVAGLGCIVASMALLATNHEIAYTSAGTALVLGGAIVLGYRKTPTRSCAAGLSMIPLLIFGIPAWLSAWDGQRSQFGHSSSHRDEYVILAEASPHFGYLEGVFIPPEATESYVKLPEFIPEADQHGQHRVFYAGGVEWLERIWPASNVTGLPLWMHDGTSYQKKEDQLLHQSIVLPAQFEQLISSVPWEHFPEKTRLSVKSLTTPQRCGNVLQVRAIMTNLNDIPSHLDPIELINFLKINFEPNRLSFENSVYREAADGRAFFAAMDKPATLGLDWKGSRASAEMILKRMNPDSPTPVTAHFYIEYTADGSWHRIWDGELSLAGGERETTHQHHFDGRQRQLRFRTELSPSARGQATAGWFAPTLLHSSVSDEDPPPLFSNPLPFMAVPDGLTASLISTDWTPDKIAVRGVSVTPEGVQVEPGGQIWLRADHPLTALDGLISAVPYPAEQMPLIRFLWYKGGRVQLLWQDRLDPESGSHDFHGWSMEARGWFGFLVDPLPDVPPVVIKIDRTIRSP